MARLRQKGSNQLPKYVMHRNGSYYLEPKGPLRQKLGGKASFPLGRSFGEMHHNYTQLMNDSDQQSPDRYTLNKLVFEYLENVSAISKAESTYKTDIKSARTILDKFSGLKPEDICTEHVYQYQILRRKELQNKNADKYAKKIKERYFNASERTIPDNAVAFLGNRTINKEISFLSAVMSYGTQIGVLKVSPCVDIKYLRELPRKRYITDQELKAFCDFVGKSNPLMSAYLKFRYITGRRDCEVLSLQYDDVVPEGIVFYIAKKSGLGVRVPVVQIWNDSFREVYNDLVSVATSEPRTPPDNQSDLSSKGNRPVICKKNGERYTTEGWSAIFRRLMNSAIRDGILEERFTLHDIRSKTASDIRNVAVASRVLAHYNIATTDKNYNLLDEKIPALDRIL